MGEQLRDSKSFTKAVTELNEKHAKELGDMTAEIGLMKGRNLDGKIAELEEKI